MSDNNLLIEISPDLLESLEIPGRPGRVDYFSFLGLTRGAVDPGGVKRAVMERSKALRVWQNSPLHGEEAVRLLPLIQRVGRVLGDDARRDAYCRELDRMLSGAKADPREEFREMIGAAAAGGAISDTARGELLRFSDGNGIIRAEADAMIAAAAPAAPTAPPLPPEAAPLSRWDELASAGSPPLEALRALADEKLRSSGLNEAARRELAAQAAARGVAESDAAEALRLAAAGWFREIIRRVAARGVLTDNQARLLLPRAHEAGLGPDEAYEIISEYTFTSASKADLATMQLTLRTFDPADIERMLAPAGDSVQYIRKNDALLSAVEAARGSRLLKRGIVIVVLLVAVVAGWILFGPAEKVETRTSEIDAFHRTARSLAAESVSEPTPPPESADPESGRLLVPPRDPGDPPPFEIAITEVTCAEYQLFMNDVLHTRRPEGWGDAFAYPEGWGARPVTGVTWGDVIAFCRWKGAKLSVAEGRVRAPTRAEYLRVLSQVEGNEASEGVPAPAELWRRGDLGGVRWIKDVRDNRMRDAVRFEGGRVYDLLGNVSEWCSDEGPEGKRGVFGGNFRVQRPEHDPAAERFESPAYHAPELGFRYVIAPPM